MHESNIQENIQAWQKGWVPKKCIHLVAICQNKQRQGIIKSQITPFSKIPDLDVSESYGTKLC